MKNLVGNALTVLILLMSCFFFAAALMVGAAQRNWKAEVTALQSRAEAAERQVNDAKSATGDQIKEIEREKVARAQQLANLFSQNRQISQQLEERNKALKVEVETNQEHLARLREAEARLAQQDKELAATKALNTDLKNNITEQFAKVKNLTQESFEQQTKLDALEQTIGDLNASLAGKSKIMNAIGVDDNYRTKDIVPKLTATVAEIGDSRDTLAIKLGSDDGIRIGHEFDIYRGKRFIGRAKVTKVRQDVAVLKSIRGLMQSPVQEGDYVTSQL
jgi:septal ring factor EnvC (AmiA/AmiB activator)